MAAKKKINRANLIKAAIILLSAALIIATPIVLLDYNIESSLLEPAPYKEILKDMEIYEVMPDLIAQQLLRLMQAPEPTTPPGFINITKKSEQILNNLSQEELRDLISMLLPSEWAQIKLENVIDQYFISMDNRIYHPKLLIAMDDIKNRLQGKIGLSFFVELIRSQPPCTDVEKEAWKTGPIEEAPACFPSETIIKESEPKTSELLYQINARMPDEASLDYFFGSFGFGQENSTGINRIQSSFARFWKARMWIRVSPAFLLIILFLLGLFHNPARSFTKLWSIPVILAGAISLIMSLILWPITRWIINVNILRELPAYISPDLVDIGIHITKSALGRITPYIAVQSILIVLLGLLLFYGDKLRQRRLKTKKPKAKKYTLE